MNFYTAKESGYLLTQTFHWNMNGASWLIYFCVYLWLVRYRWMYLVYIFFRLMAEKINTHLNVQIYYYLLKWLNGIIRFKTLEINLYFIRYLFCNVTNKLPFSIWTRILFYLRFQTVLWDVWLMNRIKRKLINRVFIISWVKTIKKNNSGV